jgi:hypothetical protein
MTAAAAAKMQWRRWRQKFWVAVAFEVSGSEGGKKGKGGVTLGGIDIRAFAKGRMKMENRREREGLCHVHFGLIEKKRKRVELNYCLAKTIISLERRP